MVVDSGNEERNVLHIRGRKPINRIYDRVEYKDRKQGGSKMN